MARSLRFHLPAVARALTVLAAYWLGDSGASLAMPPDAAGGPSPATAASCVSGPTSLCLNNQRFQVEVQWTDFQGRTGLGQAVSLTGDTGYFWFFNRENVELVVKVLDGRSLNGRFWVFYGALSNVEYTIRVTDTVTASLKTYTNPPGQFASVGDTNAFPAGSAQKAVGKVGVELGTRSLARKLLSNSASEDVGTCLSRATALCLSRGRFRVEAEWKDFEGRRGLGQAVALTGDTGYFWFFNSDNVELIVKVLDGRPINGQFWVFYGALSNVEYHITVTDTLTGAVRIYSNPAAQFASVGDTAGFRSGHRVAASLDRSRSVSREIPPSGGEITATGADGTAYSLTLPAQALLSQARVTLTPVASIDGLPLSGGLAGAVQIEPEGLRLSESATLVITPPAAVPLSEEITFSWRGPGEEFHFYPPELDTARISLMLTRFGGYGVGRGSRSDQEAQQLRLPADPEDELNQKLQNLIIQERSARGDLSFLARKLATSDLRPQLVALLRDYYNTQVAPSLEALRRRCSSFKPIRRGEEWRRKVKQLGLENDFQRELETYRLTKVDVLSRCYNDSYDRCITLPFKEAGFPHDTTLGLEMAVILVELSKEGVSGLVDTTKAERCFSFEVEFDSVFNEDVGIEPMKFRHHLKAKVPLETTFVGDKFLLVGDAESDFTVTYTGADPVSSGPGVECRIKQPVVAEGDTFSVIMSVGVYSFEDPDRVYPSRFRYWPGVLNSRTESCCTTFGNTTCVPIFPLLFNFAYDLTHGAELLPEEGLYEVAGDWTAVLDNNRIHSFRRYEGPWTWSVFRGTEKTTITLKHTPK